MERTITATTGFSNILKGNKETMHEIEVFKNKPITTTKRNLAAAGLIVVSLFSLGMFALQIITGALAVFVVTGLTGILFFGVRFIKKMDPLIQQKTKNLVLKKMVEEARKNAVYQLDNQILINAKRLNSGKEARDKMGALVKKMEGRINPANKGKSTYAKKMEMLNTVSDAYRQICINLEKAEQANKAFAEKVKEYKDMDSFASIANEAMQMFADSGNRELQDILSLAAFEHIDDEFNGALVAIENQTNDMMIHEN